MHRVRVVLRHSIGGLEYPEQIKQLSGEGERLLSTGRKSAYVALLCAWICLTLGDVVVIKAPWFGTIEFPVFIVAFVGSGSMFSAVRAMIGYFYISSMRNAVISKAASTKDRAVEEVLRFGVPLDVGLFEPYGRFFKVTNSQVALSMLLVLPLLLVIVVVFGFLLFAFSVAGLQALTLDAGLAFLMGVLILLICISTSALILQQLVPVKLSKNPIFIQGMFLYPIYKKHGWGGAG